MKTVLMACRTIEAEIAVAMIRTGVIDQHILWIESGLHNNPDKLRKRLQEELDKLNNVDRVLLGFGICGNSILYLESHDFEIIIPRVDDCITLMLGSFTKRNSISAEGGTYFLTQGWMQNESNIYSEHQYALKKYGKDITDDIYKTLLAHYKQLGLIDTGAYDFEEFLEKTKIVASALGLSQRPIKGTLTYLEQLFTGPWPDESFIIVPKNSKVTHQMLDISNCK